MKKFYAILNLLVILAVIFINGWSSARGINGNTVGGVSDIYDTLFTPAGYAFAIWGIIYLGLISLGIYQFKKGIIDRKDDDFILQIGPWLSVANIANIAWLFAWLNERIGLSLILMMFILVPLLIAVIRLNMERWDAPFPILAFVWWPLSFYSGWITVATIANVSSFLVSIEWVAILSPEGWTVVMVIIATFINLLMVILRNMREFAAVGIWALVAIALRQWDSVPSIQYAALSGAFLLFITISIHGYINRATNPLIKLREFRG